MTQLANYQQMAIHIATLYQLDNQGRLLAINEGGYPPAPRFYMGRTSEGNQWRFRHDLPDKTVQALQVLCQHEPVTEDLTQPPTNYQAIRELLASDAPIQDEYRGPCYSIPAGLAPDPRAVLIDDGNRHLLEAHFAWLLQEQEFAAAAPIAAVVEDGVVVTICFCSRLPGVATEAGLNTHDAYRGRGFAPAAVRGWAYAVRQRGWLPLYSTSWENLASQSVARKLGMSCYGEDWSVQ